MKAGRILFVAMFAFVAIAVPLSAYMTAYFALGDYRDWRADSEPMNQVERDFGQRIWAPAFFEPAAALESRLIGCPVYLYPPIEVRPAD